MSAPYDVLLSVPDLGPDETEAARRGVSAWGSPAADALVREFERAAAALVGSDHVTATGSGTAALHLALVAAGVGPGNRVIVPDWTFGATANAVFYCGALPVLTDVSRESWTLDPDLVERLLAGEIDVGGPIRAVVAVHALGHPPELARLDEACRQHGVFLIEDSAGAIGAAYGGLPAGRYGDAGILSFNGNKTVTSGGGGLVVTRDTAWHARVRECQIDEDDLLLDGAATSAPGIACGMHPVCAAIGTAQLARADKLVARKRSIADRYDAALVNRTDLLRMPRRPWATSACWMYSVLCGSGDDAEELVAVMTRARIQARVFWQALSTQAPYTRLPHMLEGVSAALSERVVALPCSTGMTDAQQDRVLDVLASWRGSASVEDGWRFA